MRMTEPVRRAALSALALCTLVLAACSGSQPQARRVEPMVTDTPAAFRGVVGSMTTINGIQPVLVSGLGLVVGLNGTGGGPYPAAVQADMERTLGIGGIGRGGPMTEGPLAGLSPRAVLARSDVAVVIVEGAIPPGAPDGAPFDVVVRALPGSATSSLEGGVLWTAEMRIGSITSYGTKRQRKLADAYGPVFLNPFVEPGSSGDAARRTIGRILGGGRVTDGLAMEIRLDNPSHARASSITAAINNRFPLVPGVVDEPPARGRNDASIALKVPRGWMERADEFIRLVQYTLVDQSFPEEYAKRYVAEIEKQPAMADELAWCLRAIGLPSRSFVQKLYDYPEIRPRMAGLRVGANLGDPLTAKPLMEIARGGAGVSPAMRAEALELLGRLPMDPNINIFLRSMLDAQELEVRAGAYEALAQRADPSLSRRVFAGKFVLDSIPSGEPMIYVRQQGEPRIVLFGDPMPMRRPSSVEVWSGRFMLECERDPQQIASESARVFYRDYRSGVPIQGSVPADAVGLVEWLAQPMVQEDGSLPMGGAGLSYSQVVGLLYELQKQGALPGAFATERDRLLARLSQAQETTTAIDDRPESEADRERLREDAGNDATKRDAGAPVPSPIAPSQPGSDSMIVPLNPDGSVKSQPKPR